MKTTLSIFFLMVLLASSLAGQTNVFPSSGNVGIGTTTPAAQLDVAGNARISAGLAVTGGTLDLSQTDTYLNARVMRSINDGANGMYLGYAGNGGGLHFYGNTGTTEQMTLTSGGNVGIGTTVPSAKLEIASGNIATFRAGVSTNAANTVAQIRSSLAVVAASGSAQSVNGAVAYDYYNAGTNPSWSGTLLVYNGIDDTNTNYDLPQAKRGSLIFQNVSAGLIATNGGAIYLAPASHTQVVIKPGGNVGIGTMNPDAKLAVNGTIHAKEVIVDTSSAAWSDYVFAPDYRLAPLSEVEQHIKAEKHLPGIPSAAEVAERGISVGELQAKLLAKIEELTLHQIAQEKRTQAQEAAVAALLAENAELRARVDALSRRR